MRRSRRALKALHQLVHHPGHGAAAHVQAVEHASDHVLFKDLHVEARANRGFGNGFKGQKPAGRGILDNGDVRGLEHAQLVEHIPCGVVGVPHFARNGKGVVFDFRFPFW